MTNMKARVAVLVVAVAMAFELGCAPSVVTVGPLDVAPKLPSPRRTGRLSLALTAVTPDAIRIEARGFPVVEVHAFRATLRRAYERAFAPALASAGPAFPDAILQVEVTEIAFVTERGAPAWRGDGHRVFGAEIVLAHGTVSHAPKARPRRLRYAQLRFAASLRERDVEVARLVGLATSEEPTAGGADSIANSLGSAVAVLYQRIARELFARRTALLSREEL